MSGIFKRLLVKKLFLPGTAFFLFIISLGISDPATIYIVIGSDTAIWDNMNTAVYNCTYNPALYVSEINNTRTVMNPEFRGRFKDSFGDTLSLTWWMMGGNIFRYAVNRNIPYPNIMTMYLMKEYYGNKIEMLGDELSLHYHTFKWTDYDGDGKYWWNQTFGFMECFDDFNFTLSQLFLEEEVFPVSYRSGWHYMDNDWQNYLNQLLPYSLHNDYPHKRLTDTEPRDNIFDWSLSPSTFIPFNPSPQNYQLPGSSKGWNVRSIHLNSIKNNTTLLNSIFTKADSGISQIVCIWGHLPETDFNTNIEAVDSVLHKYESLHPGVKFKYVTGTEAFQLYRGGSDTTSPQLNVQEILNGNSIEYQISSSEPIFQEQPFVAYKDLSENFHIALCIPTGINSWKSILPLDKALISKAGVVLSDTMGNQAYKIFRYLPDDIYIDNTHPGYSELYGSWSDNSSFAWGHNSRKALLSSTDSASAKWNFNITQQSFYHIYVQFPQTNNHAGKLKFYILSSGIPVDTIFVDEVPTQKEWVYLSTKNFVPGPCSVEMYVKGNSQPGTTITADVIKVTPLVREKAIQPLQNYISLGEVSLEDSIFFDLKIRNNGTSPLLISEILSVNNSISPQNSSPFTIPGMGTVICKMHINSPDTGNYIDTIIIRSDDPLVPEAYIPFSAKVIPYFVIIDNEDVSYYFEPVGIWNYSVAQAYGPTSRYANINQNPRAKAYFQKIMPKSGLYNIMFIVPVTENGAQSALYKIFINGRITDSLYVNQNTNSGSWVSLKKIYINIYSSVRVEVIDPGGNQSGVLRADALRIGITNEPLSADEGTNIPTEYFLYQNYPNPFNPSTKIRYQVPGYGAGTNVRLAVFDIMGREKILLLNEEKSPGIYEYEFNASDLSSGVYFCRLTAGGYASVIKMLLIK